MTTLLPPLQSLRVFEAAARNASFTQAGEELGMTQAAVSYQIKLLEERIGIQLFVRRPRQVELTEAGKRLAPSLSEAFGLITTALDAAIGQAGGTLTIHVLHTFAARWLVRHIGLFQLANPDIAVRIDPNVSLADFSHGEGDVAIWSGRGDWPGLTAHLLMKADFSPMLSPALAETIGSVREPADLLRLPLLDAGDPWWKVWFTAAGVDPALLPPGRSARMGSQTLEAGAAVAGTGVAILTPAFYPDELASGRLIQPFALTSDDGEGYWLVYPPARRNAPKIKAFRDWIEAAMTAPHLA